VVLSNADLARPDASPSLVDLIRAAPTFVRASVVAAPSVKVAISTSTQQRARLHQGLTRREAEVLAWVAEGKRNEETGVILGARPKTVGKHLERIFMKLGVETRTAAAVALRQSAGHGEGVEGS
jgi:DNA-binding CsgD family transcriptional regulator